MADTKIEELFSNLKEYIALQVEILKLQVIGKVATLTGNLVSVLLLTVVSFMALIFFSIAAALYLAERLGSNLQGFLIIAAFYGISVIVFIVFQKPLIRNPVRDKLIKELLKKKSEQK
ncbi:MAG: hypothetical protein PSX36_05090 [bacterium]|nr:hypothetical protein [bacterium]